MIEDIYVQPRAQEESSEIYVIKYFNVLNKEQRVFVFTFPVVAIYQEIMELLTRRHSIRIWKIIIFISLHL